MAAGDAKSPVERKVVKNMKKPVKKKVPTTIDPKVLEEAISLIKKSEVMKGKDLNRVFKDADEVALEYLLIYLLSIVGGSLLSPFVTSIAIAKTIWSFAMNDRRINW